MYGHLQYVKPGPVWQAARPGMLYWIINMPRFFFQGHRLLTGYPFTLTRSR